MGSKYRSKYPSKYRSGWRGGWRPAVLLALLLLAGCGQATISPLLFGPAPWTSGEQHTLALIDASGQQVGSAVYTLTSGQNSGGEPVWDFRREINALGSSELITVTMDAQGFRPQISRVQRTGVAGGQEIAEARYSEGQVDLTLLAKQNNLSVQREQAPSDARETVTLPMILRALPLAAGYATQINAYMPVVPQLERITVRVVGEEVVETQAGSFATWAVQLDAGDVQSKAWIGKEAPHILVKYIDARNKATLELLEWEAGAGE